MLSLKGEAAPTMTVMLTLVAVAAVVALTVAEMVAPAVRRSGARQRTDTRPARARQNMTLR